MEVLESPLRASQSPRLSKPERSEFSFAAARLAGLCLRVTRPARAASGADALLFTVLSVLGCAHITRPEERPASGAGAGQLDFALAIGEERRQAKKREAGNGGGTQ